MIIPKNLHILYTQFSQIRYIQCIQTTYGKWTRKCRGLLVGMMLPQLFGDFKVFENVGRQYAGKNPSLTIPNVPTGPNPAVGRQN